MLFWASRYQEFETLDPKPLVTTIPEFPNPETPKCRNATSQYSVFRNSGVFQCKGPQLLVIKNFGISNPELPKSKNSSLNNSFHDLGVRVTKDFGLHSGLTNSNLLK
jgi:hypothetical protein